MKSQGEIEAAICEGITRFEQEYMGRGPKDIRAHLIGDLLVVRLQGVLTAAEQQLVKSLPAENGRNLLKQVRTQLIEAARPVLEAMVQAVTGVKVSVGTPYFDWVSVPIVLATFFLMAVGPLIPWRRGSWAVVGRQLRGPATVAVLASLLTWAVGRLSLSEALNPR